MMGMVTSRRTISGLSFRALSTASAPLEASATTSKWSWDSRREQKRRRTTSWSSAIRMRFGVEGTCGTSLGCYGGRVKAIPYILEWVGRGSSLVLFLGMGWGWCFGVGFFGWAGGTSRAKALHLRMRNGATALRSSG